MFRIGVLCLNEDPTSLVSDYLFMNQLNSIVEKECNKHKLAFDGEKVYMVAEISDPKAMVDEDCCRFSFALNMRKMSDGWDQLFEFNDKEKWVKLSPGWATSELMAKGVHSSDSTRYFPIRVYIFHHQ